MYFIVPGIKEFHLEIELIIVLTDKIPRFCKKLA